MDYIGEYVTKVKKCILCIHLQICNVGCSDCCYRNCFRITRFCRQPYMKQKCLFDKAVMLAEILTYIINGWFFINAFVLFKPFTETEAVILIVIGCNVVIQTAVILFEKQYKRCRKAYYLSLFVALYSIAKTVLFKVGTDYLAVVLFIMINSLNFYYQLSKEK